MITEGEGRAEEGRKRGETQVIQPPCKSYLINVELVESGATMKELGNSSLELVQFISAVGVSKYCPSTVHIKLAVYSAEHGSLRLVNERCGTCLGRATRIVPRMGGGRAAAGLNFLSILWSELISTFLGFESLTRSHSYDAPILLSCSIPGPCPTFHTAFNSVQKCFPCSKPEYSTLGEWNANAGLRAQENYHSSGCTAYASKSENEHPTS